MMVSLSWLKDGLVFTSARYFKYRGAYTRVPERPGICDKCGSGNGRFHAHGRYQRSLTTLKDRFLKTIKIWRHRWLCMCCGRTMSNGSEDIAAYQPNCTLVIVALLWAYLESGKGLHNCIPQKLFDAASPKTLWRYFKQAKIVCRQTQQTLREVLIEMTEPRPWDDCFAHGLSPPEGFLERHRHAPMTGILWRALAMLRIGSRNLSIAPSLLMARARTAAQQKHLRFLV
jgi:hypothetical protein